MRSVYTALLLFIVFLIRAQGTSNEISGVIKDMDSGSPLPGVVVTVNFSWQQQSAITDSTGHYLLRTNVQYADDNFPVKLVKAGYYELNGLIYVEKTSAFNFSMKKMAGMIKEDTAVPITLEGLATNNWVFLLDVSSSMNKADKLPLIQHGLKSIVGLFRDNDRVALVTFSGSAREILPSTNGLEKEKILKAIDGIRMGGNSEGAMAVTAAYDVALANYIPNGNNRIIIATDGLFTSGAKDLKSIRKIINKFLSRNITCSVFVVGNPNESVKAELQQIVLDGHGRFALITDEASAVFNMFEEARATR